MVDGGKKGREGRKGGLRSGKIVEAEVRAGGALVAEHAAEAVVAVAARGEEGSGDGEEAEDGGGEVHLTCDSKCKDSWLGAEVGISEGNDLFYERGAGFSSLGDPRGCWAGHRLWRIGFLHEDREWLVIGTCFGMLGQCGRHDATTRVLGSRGNGRGGSPHGKNVDE